MTKIGNGSAAFGSGSFSKTAGQIVIVHKVLVLQARGGISASALTVTPIFSAPSKVSGYLEGVVFLTATAALGGTPVGVKFYVQVADYLGNFYDHPAWTGGTTITPTATTGIAFAGLITNFGAMIRIGIAASTAWTSGTLALSYEVKS